MIKLMWWGVVILIFSSLSSCANTPAVILSFQDRAFRLCAPEEVPNRDYVGKVCYRYCKAWRRGRQQTGVNCVNWALDVYDLKKEGDYLKFRDASFVLVNKARVQ
jgi:hypothetical protein